MAIIIVIFVVVGGGGGACVLLEFFFPSFHRHAFFSFLLKICMYKPCEAEAARRGRTAGSKLISNGRCWLEDGVDSF